MDRLLAEVGSWLEAPAADAGADVGQRDRAARAALRRVIVAHGLGPLLASAPALAGLPANLPDEERGWLAAQLDGNLRRLERLHEELAAILAVMAGSGIQVMPLKGALLTTRRRDTAVPRPMADLDLLVRPADRDAATAALVGLGYLRRTDPHRRPTHDVFEGAEGGIVASYDGEHPDNPRRVELHTEVRRHLWGWVDDDDLTAFLWSSAAEGRVLGQPALLPSDAALLAHVAIHATCDLLTGRGRLVQWLDLADIVTGLEGPSAVEDLPHPRLTYPSLRLAARRLPIAMKEIDLAAVERLVPNGLARWAARVPLDRACGLQSGRHLPGEASTLGARWVRWAPQRWRLLVAYGQQPPGVALGRYAFRLAMTSARRPG